MSLITLQQNLGIFILKEDNESVVCIERAAKDSLRNMRRPNKLLLLGTYIWLFILFSFLLSPIVGVVIVFSEGGAGLWWIFFLYIPLSWLSLKYFVNILWPYFSIKVLLPQKQLCYRPAPLSYSFFKWSSQKIIHFDDIEAISFKASMPFYASQNYGLQLSLLLRKKNGELLSLAFHHSYMQHTKMLKTTWQGDKNPATALNPTIYQDFQAVAQFLAQRLNVKYEEAIE